MCAAKCPKSPTLRVAPTVLIYLCSDFSTSHDLVIIFVAGFLS